MDSRITIAIERGVADVRLNRPEKLNALDIALFEEIDTAIQDLCENHSVRAVVLSGEGRAFCSGIDLEALANAPELLDLETRSRGDANLVQNIAWGWHTMPVPVIAAIHGAAFGGGLQIALGADFRIATADAELALMEMRWGMVPDVAGMALLRGLVRDDVARDIVMTGRRISGEEAKELGLVTRLAQDPHAAAMDMARSIAASSPDAIRAAKRLLNLPPETSTKDLLLAESREQQVLLKSANHKEALAAAAQKRAPTFRDWEG